MIKKSITYEGIEGPITEEFMFHLSKADVIELDMRSPGGFEAMIKRIVASNDNQEIYEEFKKIVLLSVAKKSADGKKLLKTQQIRDEFEGTDAFSELVIELLTKEDAASEFIAGIAPKVDGVPATSQATATVPAVTAPAPTPEETKVLTRAEAREMDTDELTSGLATGRYSISQEL